MPLSTRISPSGECTIYVWHIQESVEELLALLPSTHTFDLSAYKSQQRQKERLAVQLILQVAGIDTLHYEPSGKPYLSDGRFISISHSRAWACVAVHANRPIGVDVECNSDKILALAPRFMGADEMTSLPYDKTVMQLAWCAKEAAYKVYGDSLIDFRASMRVKPFPLQLPKGDFMLELVENGALITMNYQLHTAYALVYCVL